MGSDSGAGCTGLRRGCGSTFLAKHGMSVTPFRDPGGDTLCAVLIETPDLETLQAALATEGARQAEEYDGSHADTIKIFLPSQPAGLVTAGRAAIA